MLENGYIRVYRSLLCWEWYRDINTSRLFLHLLLTANYRPEQWKGIEIQRGQRVVTFPKLAEETGLTVKQVRIALEHLKRTGEVARRSTSQYTLLTVNHYDRYQSEAHDTADEGQTKGRPRADEGQQRKKARNTKKANKQVYSGGFDVQQFEELVQSYTPRYRKNEKNGG